MFPRKEISHKVRGPTSSKKTRDIFQCGSTSNAVCISCMPFERIVHSICLILQRKNFSSSAIIPCHVLISQNVVRVKWFHFHFEANAYTNEQNSSALLKRFVISLAVLIGYLSGQHSPILPARDYLLCSRARK